MSATGICSGAKLQKDRKCTSTRSELLAWLQLPTTGRALVLPLVDSRSTSPGTPHKRGTCWWRMTSYSKPGGPSTGQRSWLSSSCVQCQALLSLGTKRQEETQYPGSGFELLLRSRKLGISQRRVEWFTRWTREVVQAGHINISTFEEGLGRVMYVAGALEYERPFLAPLYKFMSLHPRGSVRKVPAYVSFFSPTSRGRLKRIGTTLAQLSRGRPLCRQGLMHRPAKAEQVWAGGCLFWTRTEPPTRGGPHGSE